MQSSSNKEQQQQSNNAKVTSSREPGIGQHIRQYTSWPIWIILVIIIHIVVCGVWPNTKNLWFIWSISTLPSELKLYIQCVFWPNNLESHPKEGSNLVKYEHKIINNRWEMYQKRPNIVYLRRIPNQWCQYVMGLRRSGLGTRCFAFIVLSWFNKVQVQVQFPTPNQAVTTSRVTNVTTAANSQSWDPSQLALVFGYLPTCWGLVN